MSNIQWTEITWNPTTGCTEVSDGCGNCYARSMHKRNLANPQQPKYTKPFHEFMMHESEIDSPLKIKKPKLIFVDSMSDLFHKNCTDAFLELIFNTMLEAKWHIYQILTKRPSRMKQFVDNYLAKNNMKTLPPHIWLGTSVENQKVTDRINHLQETNCMVRFLSCEPLLGELNGLNLNKISQVIVGGESGPGFRAVKKEWIVDLLHQCKRKHVPFFFKQWGGIHAKKGGSELDGKIYNEYPNYEQILKQYSVIA